MDRIPISQLVSEIEVSVGSSEDALRQHRASLQSTQQSSQGLVTATQQINERSVELRAKIIELSGDLGGLRSRLNELNDNRNVLGADTFRAASNVLRTEMGRIQEEIAGTRKELQSVGASAQQAGQGLDTAANSARQAKNDIKDVGEAAEKSGNSFSTSAAHVLRYAVAYAALREAKALVGDLVQSQIGLQTELVKTAALTDVNASQIGTYGRELVRLSTEVGKTSQELGAGFYFIASSGFAGADAMKILDVSAKAAASGLGETKQVADAVTSTLNAYKLSGDQAGRVTDVLVAAVREGKGEASQFAGSLGRVLPVAAAAGVSIEQVAASMAVMTRTGLSADESATALRGVLSELERPSVGAQKALASVGLSADGLRASIRDRGLLTTLQELYERTGGNVQILGEIIPNVRALVGVLSSAGSQAEAYSDVLGAMNNAQGSTQKAFETTSAAVSFQAARVRTAFEAMAGGAQDSLPKVATFLGGLADGVNDGSKAADEMRKTSDDAFATWKKNLGDAITENTRFRDTLGPIPPKLDETRKSTDDATTGMGLLGRAMGRFAADQLSIVINGLNSYIALLDLATSAAAKFNAQPKPHLNESEYNAQFGGDKTPARDDYRLNSGPVPEGYDETFRQMYHVETQAEQLAQTSYEDLRRTATGLAATSSEARKLHDVMGDLWKLPDNADPKVIEDKLKALAAAEAQQDVAWRRAFDPEEGDRRINHLAGLTSEYTQAIKTGDVSLQESAQNRINAYLQEQGAADANAAAEKKLHTERNQRAAADRQAAAAAARAAKEAYESDPLAGIRNSLNKDRDDLIGTAGSVMADLNNAVQLKGQQGARAAGEAFGNEARKWGAEIQKAGVPGWEDAVKRLMSLAEVAVVTESPEVIRAVHDLLQEMDTEVKNANIGKAIAEATAKANAQMLESQFRADDQLLRAQVSAADARADALQNETDREYDIWASRQVDRLTAADQNGRELQRIHEQWGREDEDRQTQHLRAQADRDEQAKRAEEDRARQSARAIRDIQEGQTRAQGDLNRSRQREEADAQYEHNKRIKDIQTAGGPNVAKAVADENARYQQSIEDRTRKRGEDDAEATIKRSEQIGDAQRRIAEQTADAQRRSGEQASDLKRKQGEQDDDLTKARQRQLTARVDQQADSEWLKDQRILHEKAFYTDAEFKAAQKLQNDMSRIDARYDHELAKANATSELIQARRDHDIEEAGIKAQARFGQITEDQATGQLGELDKGYVEKQTGIQNALRERDTQIDKDLRDSVAGSRRYAPGFAPGGGGGTRLPSEEMGARHWGDYFASVTQQDSIVSALMAKGASFLPQGGSTQQGTIDVRIVDIDGEVLQDFSDAASDRPVQMDGDSVEDVQSKVRRNRNRSRTIG